ncbi:MAG: winged helix-turn-helix transcriptional regulator [Adlercreutzia equolifaciens]
MVQLRSLGTAPSYGKQLRELVADGFLARTNFGEVPPHVEYTLTPQGESFVPILLAMKQWGEKEPGL